MRYLFYRLLSLIGIHAYSAPMLKVSPTPIRSTESRPLPSGATIKSGEGFDIPLPPDVCKLAEEGHSITLEQGNVHEISANHFQCPITILVDKRYHGTMLMEWSAEESSLEDNSN